MNVFDGAWGYKNDAGKIEEQNDEFAAAMQNSANCNFMIINRQIEKRVFLFENTFSENFFGAEQWHTSNNLK